VRLGTRFGILTEYTAFLAREGTDLSRPDEVLAQAAGWGAVNQSLNNESQIRQRVLNPRNAYVDQNLERVEVATVQQVNDRAFFRRGARWVDGRLVAREEQAHPARVVEFGSDEFQRLLRRLAASGRQGSVALRGEILMEVDGETLLLRNPGDE